MKIEDFEQEFIELFGFLLAQEIAKNAPVDTGRLQKSFPATLNVTGNIVTFIPPKYWEFVEFGTIKMPANAFVRRTLDSETESIAEKVIDIISKG